MNELNQIFIKIYISSLGYRCMYAIERYWYSFPNKKKVDKSFLVS